MNTTTARNTPTSSEHTSSLAPCSRFLEKASKEASVPWLISCVQGRRKPELLNLILYLQAGLSQR